MVSHGIFLKALLVPSTGRDTSAGLPRSSFHPCFGAFLGARLHSGAHSGHDHGPMGGAAPEPLDFSQISIPARSRGHAQRPGRPGLTRPMEPCSHSVTCHQTTGPALSQRCPWVLQGAGHPPGSGVGQPRCHPGHVTDVTVPTEGFGDAGGAASLPVTGHWRCWCHSLAQDTEHCPCPAPSRCSGATPCPTQRGRVPAVLGSPALAFCPISSRHRGAAEPEPGADRRHKDQGGQVTVAGGP